MIPKIVKDNPTISRAYELKLAQQAEKGNKEAREKLISANILTIYCVAQKFVCQQYDIHELMSIGYIGLIKAIDHFKWQKGYRLSALTTTIVYREIINYLRKQQNLFTNQEKHINTIQTNNTKLPYQIEIDEDKFFHWFNKHKKIILGEKELKIFEMRLNNTTFIEISKTINLHPESIRQNFNRSCQKIREEFLKNNK